MEEEAKKIISCILQRIKYKAGISGEDKIKIDLDDTANCGISDFSELEDFLKGFKKDKLIKNYEFIREDPDYLESCYEIILSKNFNDLLGKIKKTKNKRKKTKTYFVTLKNREIWINDKYLIAKTNFDTKNEQFFDYVFQNPNKKITKKELEENWKTNFDKSFSKIVNEIGFKGEIRKVFFPDISGKTAVRFLKKVSEEEMKKRNINKKLLIKELEAAHLRRKK